MFWKIMMIAIFFIVTFGIGIYYRKSASNSSDFMLGGRNVGPWLSAFAYGTTYFSATVFVGYAGQFGWSFGVSAVWVGIGNALIGSLLAWMLLGRRTRIMTKWTDSSTMPNFFEQRYNSRGLKLFSSLIIVIFLVPYSASVYKGLSEIFAQSFSIDFIWCIIGMAVLTGAFVIAGGYMGTAVNTFIQGIIMLVGMVLVIAGVLRVNGGLLGSFEALSKFRSNAMPEFDGVYVSILGTSPIDLLSVVLLTSLGTLGLPQMVSKFYAIKNEKAIRMGTIISTVFAVIIAGGSYFIGAFARLFWDKGEPVFDLLVPNMISKALPDAIIGLVLLMVLSASISSLASLALTAGSTFIVDLVQSVKKEKLEPKKEVLAVKAVCGIFIVVSVVVAVIPNSLITALMGLSWGALAGAFLGPFIYGLFWKKTTPTACLVSMIFGVGFVTANQIFRFLSPSMAGSAAMLASLIIVPVVSLFTRRLDKSYIDKIFACMEEKVVAPAKDVLEEY